MSQCRSLERLRNPRQGEGWPGGTSVQNPIGREASQLQATTLWLLAPKEGLKEAWERRERRKGRGKPSDVQGVC